MNQSVEEPPEDDEPSTTGNKDEESTSTLSFLSAVELQVFKNFVTNYKSSGELLREDAIALDFVFGTTTIQQIFEMIEEDRVLIHQSDSKRVMIKVFGQNSSETYWIPPGFSECQCMSFVHGKKLYCKHILAAHLLLAITPKEEYKEISEEELDQVFHDLVGTADEISP